MHSGHYVRRPHYYIQLHTLHYTHEQPFNTYSPWMTIIDVHVFGDAAVCSIHILSNPISQFWKVCVCVGVIEADIVYR